MSSISRDEAKQLIKKIAFQHGYLSPDKRANADPELLMTIESLRNQLSEVTKT
jgi:hypothetical protein